MTIRIARLRKNLVEYNFQEIEEVPFDYSFQIRQGDHSQIHLHQYQQESKMILTLESEDHWDMFLRNDLFLSLLSLSSSMIINHRMEFTKKQVEEILRGSDIKIKWEKKFQNIISSFNKVIVFKEDLVMFKDLFQREKLDIISMAEAKRDNAFRYVKKLGVKLVTETNFRTDIAATIQRLKQIFKETSGEERFRVKGNKQKFDEIQKQVREAYVNSFTNSVDSQVQKQTKQNIINMLEERFSEIDTKMQKRQLNLTKFGLQIEYFINQIIQGEDNKEKVQTLIGFLLQKVLKFFRLKPQEICWSGLPTVRQVISQRSSRSRDYDDYFQEKQQLTKTISDLKAQVQKYQKQLQLSKIVSSKVTSKPSTPMNSAKPLFTSSKFTKPIAKTAQKQKEKEKEQKQVKQNKQKIFKDKQTKEVKQKNTKTQTTKLKTGASSRSSLSSTASLNLNKSVSNMTSLLQKNKRLVVPCLQTPLPLLEMKLNKTMNVNSGLKTPKTTSKPKFDSAKKPLEPSKPSLRNTKVSSRLLK